MWEVAQRVGVPAAKEVENAILMCVSRAKLGELPSFYRIRSLTWQHSGRRARANSILILECVSDVELDPQISLISIVRIHPSSSNEQR